MKFRIETVMQEKGINTQKELAAKIGVSETSLSRAMNGIPSTTLLEKIAIALEVDITELFDTDLTKTRCPYCGHTLQIK